LVDLDEHPLRLDLLVSDRIGARETSGDQRRQDQAENDRRAGQDP